MRIEKYDCEQYRWKEKNKNRQEVRLKGEKNFAIDIFL